jgi:hypothetical protein
MNTSTGTGGEETMSFDAGGAAMGEPDHAAEVSADSRGRERRATYRALAYWEKLCAEGAVPTPERLDADAPAELRPSLFVVRLRYPAEQSLIEEAGSALDGICGKQAAGRPLAEAIPASLRDTFADLTRVIRTYGKPVLNSGTTLTGKGQTVLYRSILMPIGGADGKVTCYLGAIGYRQLPPLN